MPFRRWLRSVRRMYRVPNQAGGAELAQREITLETVEAFLGPRISWAQRGPSNSDRENTPRSSGPVRPPRQPPAPVSVPRYIASAASTDPGTNLQINHEKERAAREAPRQVPTQAPRQAPREAAREAPRKAPREASEETLRQAPREAPKEAPRETLNEAPKEAAEGATAQKEQEVPLFAPRPMRPLRSMLAELERHADPQMVPVTIPTCSPLDSAQLNFALLRKNVIENEHKQKLKAARLDAAQLQGGSAASASASQARSQPSKHGVALPKANLDKSLPPIPKNGVASIARQVSGTRFVDSRRPDPAKVPRAGPGSKYLTTDARLVESHRPDSTEMLRAGPAPSPFATDSSTRDLVPNPLRIRPRYPAFEALRQVERNGKGKAVICADQSLPMYHQQIVEAVEIFADMFPGLPYAIAGLAALGYYGYRKVEAKYIAVVCTEQTGAQIRDAAGAVGIKLSSQSPRNFYVTTSDNTDRCIRLYFTKDLEKFSIYQTTPHGHSNPYGPPVVSLPHVLDFVAEQYLYALHNPRSRNTPTAVGYKVIWVLREITLASAVEHRLTNRKTPVASSDQFLRPFLEQFPIATALFRQAKFDVVADKYKPPTVRSAPYGHGYTLTHEVPGIPQPRPQPPTGSFNPQSRMEPADRAYEAGPRKPVPAARLPLDLHHLALLKKRNIARERFRVAGRLVLAVVRLRILAARYRLNKAQPPEDPESQKLFADF
ncbi:hypothetical protein HIM_03336 [Hirsutella minnesotensis 3608]|uniref:Uncharacterized protein n=1 Tax=Hirsutella minnesotensis 3608 TaxID=1043627 RepID=A0A0F7ZQC6_9HYPO|nr:hypothetical protein HIM_03336 [Hirsutella minnesotensis 3608]